MTMTWAVCSAAPPSPRSPPSPWAPRPRSARWLSMCRQGGIFCKKTVQTTNTCTIPYFPVQYNIQYSCTGLGRKSEIKIKKTVPEFFAQNAYFFIFCKILTPPCWRCHCPSRSPAISTEPTIGSPSGLPQEV